MATRLTQAMLERALGGDEGAMVLAELMGINGVANATAVTEILTEVDAEANSYISNAVDVGDAAVATAPLLLMREKACAVYLVWLRGSRSQAVPAAVIQDRADAIEWYEKVGQRRASIGTATRVAGSQPVQQVLQTATESYFRTTDTSIGPAGPRGRFGGFA